jgi:predicted porin
VKYRVDVGQFRAAGLYQFGGYGWNNASTNAWEGQVGGDIPMGGYGTLSLDAIYSKVIDAVSLSSLSAPVAPAAVGTLGATISDDSSVMLLAKYTIGPWKFYGGYENILFQAPSNFQTGFTSIAGIPVLTANIKNTTYSLNQKDLQVVWTGAKYAISPTLDIAAAYYHYNQDDYNPTPAKSCVGPGTAQASSCAGTLNAYSVMIDWRFAPKFDAYAGVMFSSVANGLASGYLHTSSADPMAGLRFTF